MTDIIVIDIETTTWFSQPEIAELPRDLQIPAMKFGCAVTWDKEGGYQEWSAPTGAWNAIACSEVDLVCGWNIISFDLPILAREVKGNVLDLPPVFDLFAIIRDLTGRWYKLDDVAKANLGSGKTADGLQAAQWLAEGGEENVRKALEYCQVDVRLEKELTEWALKSKPILLPGMKRNGQEKDLSLVLDWYNKKWRLTGGL